MKNDDKTCPRGPNCHEGKHTRGCQQCDERKECPEGCDCICHCPLCFEHTVIRYHCTHEFQNGASAVAVSSGHCVKCSQKVAVSLVERVEKLEKALVIVVRGVQFTGPAFSGAEVDKLIKLMEGMV